MTFSNASTNELLDLNGVYNQIVNQTRVYTRLEEFEANKKDMEKVGEGWNPMSCFDHTLEKTNHSGLTEYVRLMPKSWLGIMTKHGTSVFFYEEEDDDDEEEEEVWSWAELKFIETNMSLDDFKTIRFDYDRP